MTGAGHGLITRHWNRPWLTACALAGGAVAAAAVLFTAPGEGRVIPLASPVAETHTGTATVQLGDQPSGTTGLEMELICITAGSFVFPDGATSICSEADASSPSGNRSGLLVALEQGQDSVTIKTEAQSRWQLSVRYVKQERNTVMIWDAR
ncbi:hypothetical protein [Arthrobacter sp. NPDC093139]|uniref:hypothetical protein n=1 Tax=Arthrobacter sp. NPDC093139 TaxID=3363945 RepID=UPI003811F186